MRCDHVLRVSSHLVQKNCQCSSVFFRTPTAHITSMLTRVFSRMSGRRGSCIIYRRIGDDPTQIVIPLITGGIPIAAVLVFWKQFKELMAKDNVHLQQDIKNLKEHLQESSAKDRKSLQESLKKDAEMQDSRLGYKITSIQESLGRLLLIQESSAKDMKSTQESSAKDVKGAIELLESRLGNKITLIQESLGSRLLLI